MTTLGKSVQASIFGRFEQQIANELLSSDDPDDGVGEVDMHDMNRKGKKHHRTMSDDGYVSLPRVPSLL